LLWDRILASDHSSLRLPLYFVAMRNRWDFFQTALVGKPTYYVGWVSLWLSVLSALTSPITGSVGGVAGFASLLTGTLTAIVEFARSRVRPSEVRFYDLTPTFAELDVRDGVLVRFPRLTGVSDRALRALARQERSEVAVVWPDLDKRLASSAPTFTLSRAKVPLPAVLRKDKSKSGHPLAKIQAARQEHI